MNTLDLNNLQPVELKQEHNGREVLVKLRVRDSDIEERKSVFASSDTSYSPHLLSKQDIVAILPDETPRLGDGTPIKVGQVVRFKYEGSSPEFVVWDFPTFDLNGGAANNWLVCSKPERGTHAGEIRAIHPNNLMLAEEE